MTKEEIKLLFELGYSPKEVMQMTDEDAPPVGQDTFFGGYKYRVPSRNGSSTVNSDYRLPQKAVFNTADTNNNNPKTSF
jgi:hypothetical protein